MLKSLIVLIELQVHSDPDPEALNLVELWATGAAERWKFIKKYGPRCGHALHWYVKQHQLYKLLLSLTSTCVTFDVGCTYPYLFTIWLNNFCCYVFKVSSLVFAVIRCVQFALILTCLPFFLLLFLKCTCAVCSVFVRCIICFYLFWCNACV